VDSSVSDAGNQSLPFLDGSSGVTARAAPYLVPMFHQKSEKPV
jgi:hypothetical protein